MKEGETIMTTKKNRELRPATTAEAREEQLISAAMNLAERQILDGTASSQIISHFLKMGSPGEKLKREIQAEEKKMMIAKTEALRIEKKIEELYEKALSAMQIYSGQEVEVEEEEDEFDEDY